MVLTWGLFSVTIGLAMAADVALVVKNGLNGVIVSNCGWWGRWGNLPGLVDDGGSGWQWWRGWAVCRMQRERDGCGGRKQSGDVASVGTEDSGFGTPRAVGPAGGHIIT